MINKLHTGRRPAKCPKFDRSAVFTPRSNAPKGPAPGHESMRRQLADERHLRAGADSTRPASFINQNAETEAPRHAAGMARPNRAVGRGPSRARRQPWRRSARRARRPRRRRAAVLVKDVESAPANRLKLRRRVARRAGDIGPQPAWTHAAGCGAQAATQRVRLTARG